MMDVFRRAAKGWTAKILIGLLVISFGIWGIADVFTGFRVGALAKVGSTEISASQFEQTFRQALQNYSSQLGQAVTPERARELGIDRQILNQLLHDAAMVSEAQSLKLAVGDAQIVSEVHKNPAFKDAGGNYDPAVFKEFLERSGQSEAGFLANERQQYLRAAIADTVQGQFGLPKTLVEAAAKHTNEQRDARYFIVKAEAGEVQQPGDADVKSFYDANPQRYTAPEYRSIAIVKAEPGDVAAAIAISEDELKAGYEKFKAAFFTPERRTLLQTTFPSVEDAAKAKVRIANGEDFLTIAKERGFTEADATWTDRTAEAIIDPVIASAAFSLKEGDVSEPVEGALSVMLLKAVKITPEHQKTLDEVRADLTKRLQLEKATEQLREIYNSVEDGRAAQTPFEEIAKGSNIPFVVAAAVDANGNDKDGKPVALPHKEDVIKAAFATEAGIENDAISTDDGGYVWYEVREVVPSQVRPFDTVKDQVKADVIADRVRLAAIDKGRKLAERANAGTSFDELAKEAGAEIKTVQGMKRGEAAADFDGRSVTAVFSVPEGSVTFAPEADNASVKVIQAQAVLTAPFDLASAEATQIRDQLSRSAGDDALGSYLVALQNQLGFTVNETLWRQITGAPQQ
jgi:peptidyl-prolyl cis-trans isomerase D